MSSNNNNNNKNVENARRFLWDGETDLESTTSARSRNTQLSRGSAFSTRDYVVDQSVNLMDIGGRGDAGGGAAHVGASSSSSSSAGGGGGISGLFRASMEVENLNRFDEYGDAAPSADAEEYNIDSDKRRRRVIRIASLWASCSSFSKVTVVVALIGLCLIVIMTLAVTLMGDNGTTMNTETTGTVDKINNNNKNAVSGSGSGSATNNNNNNNNNNSNSNNNDEYNSRRYTNIQTRIVQEQVTSQEMFDGESSSSSSSPQKSALDWLVLEDPAHLGHDHPALLDRYGLAVFYYSSNNAPKTAGGGWKNSDHWMTEQGICSWYGIECVPREQEATSENNYTPFTKTYDDHARITGIRLQDNTIEGIIPDEWGSSAFDELLTLDLEDNQLSSTLPTTLGVLPKLRDLLVKGNALVGTLPEEYGALTELHQLNVGHNQLQGKIPNSWFSQQKLQKLRYFSVSRNRLTGTFPDLSKMTRMTGLFLEDNDFEGSLPESLGTMTGLLDLRIGQNRFSGPITVLTPLQNLETLYINDNGFTGNIPDMFDHLFRLHELVMQNNQFVGSIPLTVTHLQSLKTLNLASNQLDGTIPPGLGLLTDAVAISLNHNQFEGAIPTLLGRLDDITHLSLNHNAFSGSIPTELGDCFRLVALHLEHNQLTGDSIPTQLGELTGLESLRLESNELAAGVSMPSEICALRRDADLSVLAADCLVDEQVSCTCCTECL